MKKKIEIIIFSLISIHCFAQDLEPKFYVDISKGFRGYAVADFWGTLEELDYTSEKDFLAEISEKIGDKLSSVSKLTKENNWLFHRAMNEWDYEKNEIYVVLCEKSIFSHSCLLFLAVVKGENDFSWIAYTVDEDDDLDDFFDNIPFLAPD